MNRFVVLMILSVFVVQCGRENDTVIGKNHLGKIDKNTTIEELDRIFERDSVAKYPEDSSLFREYRVYGINGKLDLAFVPFVKNDSIKGLELVKIYSSSYSTDKGISVASTFKDIANNYSIDKIEPSFSAAILFIDEINATISLNKQDLGLDEFDMRDIQQGQIPDEAGIKYITLWFE